MWKRFKEQIKTEYYRYSTTKYGKLFAILIYYFFISLSQNLVHWFAPILLQRVSKETLYVIGVSSSIIGTQIAWCLYMLVIYNAKIPFFQQYRVDPRKPWPWEENKETWMKLLSKSIKITSFYIFIFIPINLWVDSKISFQLTIDTKMSPDLSYVIPQLLLMMVLEDFFFFCFHWLLHRPSLYKYHKVHHQFTTTVSIAGLHFHILEFFLIQSVSSLANMRILLMFGPLHLSTLMCWFILRIYDANHAHSGYNFSWAPIQLLPFCTNDQFHDYHHSHNCGNYSSHFRWWDTIFGTNADYHKFKLRQIQATEKKKRLQ